MGGVVRVTHRSGDPASARNGEPVLTGPVSDLLQLRRVRFWPCGTDGTRSSAHLPAGRYVWGKSIGQLVGVRVTEIDFVRNSLESERDGLACASGQGSAVKVVDKLDKGLLSQGYILSVQINHSGDNYEPRSRSIPRLAAEVNFFYLEEQAREKMRPPP
jgi:hypothetical protein